MALAAEGLDMTMERGSVYVLLNASYPGVAKVGRTTRPASERVAELSGATGVPTPFVLAFNQPFEDCARGERAVHAELDRLGWRVAQNREFFRADPSDIIRIIQAHAAAEAGGDAATPDIVAARAATAAGLLAEADDHYHGRGDTLQDTAEASRLYRAAVAAGSRVAVERLAMLYATRHVDPKAGRRLALRLLKRGAQAGNYYCLASMAGLFAQERHMANFIKAWDQFFHTRAASRCEEAEAEPGVFAAACHSYIALCLDAGIEPQHTEDMAGEARAIQMALLAALKTSDPTNTDADARNRLVNALRWSYEHLLPAGEGDGMPDSVLAPGWQEARHVRRRLPRWRLRRSGPAAPAPAG